MNKSQLIAFDSLAFRFEVGHLTSDQSLAPGATATSRNKIDMS